MTLRRIISICTSFALLCSLVLVSSVGSAQQVEREPSTKKTKKAKRKRQEGVEQIVLPATTPATTATSAPATEEVKTISPGAPVNTKRTVSLQSVKGPQEPDTTSQPVRIEPVQKATVVLRELTTKRSGISTAVLKGQSTQAMPVPGTIAEPETPTAPDSISTPETEQIRPLVASPNPSQSFQGEFDEALGGGASGSFTIPPDTMGAVGIDKVMSSVNNNIVIQDKTTGARLSVVSLSAFWASTGATNVFDPRALYDPYNNRWIVAAAANAQTANSAILVGISQTPDPQGAYFLFRFVVGCAAGAAGCNASGEWADFPMLGFNHNWVTLTWNQFTINTGASITGKGMVLDYPTLRANTANSFGFNVSTANAGFCLHPATTFSPTEDTVFMVGHLSSGGATYKLNTITGVFPATPVLTIGATQTRPGGGWTQPGGDFLPQQCIPGVGAPTQTCPATPRALDTGDAFVRSNVVFRNGKIYYPQTIALPSGGLTANSRTAAQWTAINPDGTFFDGGRVQDATATTNNGGKLYAYPSIAVNKNNDVLLGFSEFESDDYVDSGYAFRLGSDPAGTMRDPVIYKDGEDYYSKTFSGTRNRWGDYSHTVIDPVNDRDLWTMQEYAGLRVGTTGQGTNDSRWATWWAKVTAPAAAGDLVISEFRLRGPSGANDEFVEVYNRSSAPVTVTTVDGSAGYALAASDGVARFVIPNGTIIPAKGHYLGANSVAYSLSGHPNGTADVTWTTDIPDNAGIALFSTATAANFALGTRLDAAGSTSEANTLYKEGTGYPALTPFSIDYSFYRSFCPNNASTTFGTALQCGAGSGGTPKDTDNNSADFVFVDTNGTSAGAGQRLGAPGPENTGAPIERNSIPVLALDNTVGASLPPNRVRDFTSDPANNSTFGTLDVRRRVQNNTGAPITRLRFRVIDINTFPSPSGFADLRTRTSTSVVVSGINDAGTCSPGATPCTITVQGTTLEQPPSQPNGGAFNSTYSAGTITLGTPLAAGDSLNVRFLMGIQQTGSFRFFINVEALP